MTPADLSIEQQAKALRDGSFSARELAEAHLSRIADVNDKIRAFVHVDPEAVRLAADEADDALRQGLDKGPLHGIPFAVKDLIDMERTANCCGSKLFKDRIADNDAAVIARLRSAGAIPLGRVATYEFALTGPSSDAAYPPATNPWSENHITGGSSSGSAAAVASGMVRIAIGTDTGGSVRSPASYCGLVGFKPTRGLIPMTGVFPLSHSLDHLGPMAASVREAALLLSAMVGRPFALSDTVPDVRGLRIGYAREWFASDPMAAPELIEAMDAAASTLSLLGAQLSLIELPDYALSEAAAAIILHFEALQHHRTFLAEGFDKYGRQPRQSLAAGAALTPQDVARARDAGTRTEAEINALLRDHDVIIAPTTLAPAPPISAFQDDETVWTPMRTITFNLTGHPAISVPIGFATGLPLGMQIIGAHHAEELVLRIAAAFESATDHSVPKPCVAYVGR